MFVRVIDLCLPEKADTVLRTGADECSICSIIMSGTPDEHFELAYRIVANIPEISYIFPFIFVPYASIRKRVDVQLVHVLQLLMAPLMAQEVL